MSQSGSGSKASSFANFAFNIYGMGHNSGNSGSNNSSINKVTAASAIGGAGNGGGNGNGVNYPSGKVHYTSDREISAISQLHLPVQYTQGSSINHVVLGGRIALDYFH